MDTYIYHRKSIDDPNWMQHERDNINQKAELISDVVNCVIKERSKSGFPLAFCKEAAKYFDNSLEQKDNPETKVWLNTFTDDADINRLHIKKFFDKKLYSTINNIYKKNIDLDGNEELVRTIEETGSDRIKLLKDYAAVLSSDISWKCFIEYKNIQQKQHFSETGRKIDEKLANQKALSDMYHFIDETKEKLNIMNNTTSYDFYMGNDMQEVLLAVKETRERLTEQGFDDVLISNTENHMKSILAEEKWHLHKNLYSQYDIKQGIELAMYEDMYKTIKDFYFGRNTELNNYAENAKNAEKFPTYQAQLLINMKKITDSSKNKEESGFTKFDNVKSYEEQTTYRMKLMREKDLVCKKHFDFYIFKSTRKMASAALKVEDYLGSYDSCTELTSAQLPQMPTIYDYDGEKVLYVSQKSWDSYMKHADSDCYATIEDQHICDMNKIVIVDEKCRTQILEPQIETIEGKRYWKGFKKDEELTKSLEKKQDASRKFQKTTTIESQSHNTGNSIPSINELSSFIDGNISNIPEDYNLDEPEF